MNSAAAPRWDDFLVPDKAIITTVRAGTYKKINTDVLIVASGGSYPTSAIQAHRHGMLLVVDIADDYDGMARAGTRSRLRHYQAQGYTVTAAPRWLLGGG